MAWRQRTYKPGVLPSRVQITLNKEERLLKQELQLLKKQVQFRMRTISQEQRIVRTKLAVLRKQLAGAANKKAPAKSEPWSWPKFNPNDRIVLRTRPTELQLQLQQKQQCELDNINKAVTFKQMTKHTKNK